MTLRDSLRADREKLKALSGRARVQFVWDYYKLPIIAVAVCLFLAAAVAGTELSRRGTVMYAVFVNTDVTDTQRDPAPLEQLLSAAGVDMGGRHIDVTDSLYLGTDINSLYDGETLQVLSALFGISDLDLFAADEGTFRRYAEKDAFADLSKLIPAQLLEAHAADLYTYAVEGGQTVVGGIVLHPGSVLHTAGYYHGDIVVGAAINGENLDMAIRFIQALL